MCCRIVPFEEIDKKNFLTVSTHGVMTHSPGEIIFTSLDDWERDYDFFCKLRQVNKIRTGLQSGIKSHN